ncbi:MAG: AAA family ATPase [Clostridiales Family XIII bacterium]|jgi:chromosome partitioning protein|nr:AAA family ATPase [Clostridiales Family XIII bacterium]
MAKATKTAQTAKTAKTAKIVVLTNQKGGVGKTTTACAVIAGLARKGFKTLGIDLDPQGNFGFCLGADTEGPTVYDLMKGSKTAAETIQTRDGIDIIASNILLSGAELEFSMIGRETLLKRGLAPVKDQYDYIIIDTPPALNILTVNAYTAADALIVIMLPEILSLMGISQLRETVELVKSIYNPQIETLGILLNKYDGRRILTHDVEDMAKMLAKELGTKVFKAKIRASVAAAEFPAHEGRNIFTYAPKSNAAKDYMLFVDELLKQKGMRLDGQKKQ